MKNMNFSGVITGNFLWHSTGHGKFLLHVSMKSINDIILRIIKVFIIYHSRTDEKVFSLQNV